MIINTGMRTDIPAFYSDWFFHRIKEEYVYTRNPYYPSQVSRYRLDPEVVDCICFCTKNPEPMLNRLDELSQFAQFWFVTITPYGKEIEPNVPDVSQVIQSFQKLSDKVGVKSMSLRYDPIFISDRYTVETHIEAFKSMAEQLEGYTDQCVISFIDLYQKTRRNFPQVREVRMDERLQLGKAFAKIGQQHGITIRSCCEGTELQEFGVDVAGCLTKEILERAVGSELLPPKSKKSQRDACNCLLGNDIGTYNTCNHACLYCYANYDRKTVVANMKLHDPASPFLIGGPMEGDIVKEAKQESYRNNQLKFDFL